MEKQLTVKIALQRLRAIIEYGKYKQWNSDAGERQALSIMNDFHNGSYGSGEGMWVQVGKAFEFLNNEVCFNKDIMQLIIDRYLVSRQPNYRSKDGAIKQGVYLDELNDSEYKWLIPKNDLMRV